MFAAPSVAVETSEGAAERVRPTARDAHRVILALLVVHEHLTDFEIRKRTAWGESYARPRRWELEGMGLVEKCDGEHGRPLVKRLTDTGSPAFAYRLTSLGRQRAQEEGDLRKRRFIAHGVCLIWNMVVCGLNLR